MRFRSAGELVYFHQTYADGKKAFPFQGKNASSWSKSIEVAERFGRFQSAVSNFDAQISWFSRMKEKKDYDGHGGYIIGARIHPDQCLVDLTHPDLPFGGGVHGGEGEVILLPNTNLSAKVYKIFGDVEREVKEFLDNKYRSHGTPLDPDFFSQWQAFVPDDVQGDADHGKVVFKVRDTSLNEAKLTPRQWSESGEGSIAGKLREQLYNFKWINDTTIEYHKMSLPGRVASRYLRGA